MGLPVKIPLKFWHPVARLVASRSYPLGHEERRLAEEAVAKEYALVWAAEDAFWKKWKGLRAVKLVEAKALADKLCASIRVQP